MAEPCKLAATLIMAFEAEFAAAFKATATVDSSVDIAIQAFA